MDPPLIIDAEETIRGRPYRIEESFDFVACLNGCDLQYGGYLGSKITWSDNRDPPNTMRKGLDRVTYNSQWFDTFSETTVTHLARTCSDHTPLLIRCIPDVTNHIKYLKFLNICTEHRDYLEVVQNARNGTQQGNPLHTLHQKIKKVSKSLSIWSRIAFGDFYEEPKRLENLIKDLEEASITNNNQENRQNLSRAKAEYHRFLITG